MDDPSECKKKEMPLNWGIVGPEGPPGQGGGGDALDFYRVTGRGTANATQTGLAVAMCDSGDLVTGGGFFGVNSTSLLKDGNPQKSSGVVDRWAVVVYAGAVTDTFDAYAICADTNS